MARGKKSQNGNDDTNESTLNFLVSVMNLFLDIMRAIAGAARHVDDPEAREELHRAHEQAARGWRQTRDEIERRDRRRR